MSVHILLLTRYAVIAAVLVSFLGCSDRATPEETALTFESANPGDPLQSFAARGNWLVKSIDGAPTLAQARPTMTLEEGRVGGTTGCNRYFGGVSVNDSKVRFSGLGATLMACEEDAQRQEQRFLAVFEEPLTLSLEPDGSVTLSDSHGVQRLEMTAQTPEENGSATVESLQDLPPAGAAFRRFECAEIGTIMFRFVGPETIELHIGGEHYALPRQRSASGALYAANGIEFWNRGDAASVTLGSQRYECSLVDG